MPAVSVPLAIGVAGSVAGGVLGSSGAKNQVKASQEAIAYQKMRDEQNQRNFQPYLKFGGEQLNSLNSWLDDPNNNPMSHLDPGYEFRRDQGNKGITANAGTAGLLQSGDTLRGLTQYGQDMSSQEYNNAFGRYLNEGRFKQGLANTGLEAAGGIAGFLNQGAANVGNITANTDYAAPQQTWADAAGGIGGMAGNAFARKYSGGSPGQSVPGGSNIFGGSGGGGTMKYAQTPYYNG